VTKQRGIFEKFPGSGVWWVRYSDTSGRIHRELAGHKSAAIQLYQKRKTQMLEGKKLPEKLRRRTFRFSEIAENAKEYCKAHNAGQKFDLYRIGRLVEEFGARNAELPIEDLRQWFNDQVWEAGTHNRYKSTLSLIYRLAIESGKMTFNPARLIKRKREDNARVRFLNQFAPLKTELNYLRPH
jgi:hypothetical protein